MSITEALGTGVVIYLCCSSVIAHLWMLNHGRKRVNKHMMFGGIQEHEAQRTYQAMLHPERN